jgi:hypothetical protein
MLTKSVTAERWWDLCWNIMVWFMWISYSENFLTWQYWLIGGWFDNIFGMEHDNTYIADSGITEGASLSFSTRLCSTEICIRWMWDNNILYRVASLHFINWWGALEFWCTHMCDISMHVWMKIDFTTEWRSFTLLTEESCKSLWVCTATAKQALRIINASRSSPSPRPWQVWWQQVASTSRG